jgi:pyruvate dehydrogenase E1 component
METERLNRLDRSHGKKRSWIEMCLAPTAGPIIAATDYVRAVPDLIRTWVPRRYVTLGTDGFGRSDTRAALRRFFEIDRTSIVLAGIRALADDGSLSNSMVSEAMQRYGFDSSPAPWLDHRRPK